MRWIASAWSLLGGGLLAAVFYLAQVARLRPGFGVLGQLILDLGPIDKLALLIIIAGGVGALFAGASAVRRNSGLREPFLTLAAFGLPAIGLVSAARRGLQTYQIAQATHTTHLEVVAPSIAEALLLAAIAFLLGAIAAALAYAIELQARQAAKG